VVAGAEIRAGPIDYVSSDRWSAPNGHLVGACRRLGDLSPEGLGDTVRRTSPPPAAPRINTCCPAWSCPGFAQALRAAKPEQAHGAAARKEIVAGLKRCRAFFVGTGVLGGQRCQSRTPRESPNTASPTEIGPTPLPNGPRRFRRLQHAECSELRSAQAPEKQPNHQKRLATHQMPVAAWTEVARTLISRSLSHRWRASQTVWSERNVCGAVRRLGWMARWWSWPARNSTSTSAALHRKRKHTP